MKIHEFAKIFPDMNAEQFSDLKADIKKNGQINPIITFEGAVIDGKNRLKACKDLKMKPYTEEYKGDPENLIPFVIIQNLQRRHMDSSQRAAASLKCLDLLEAEAKKRQGKRNDLKPEEIPPIKGPSAEQAAKMFGTNKEYVKGAKKIKEKMPEKLKEIESGEKSIPQVLKEVKEKEETEAAANRNGKETLEAFDQLYTRKHNNRASAIHSVNSSKFSKRLEENFASILKSYKTHRDDLSTILHKFQTNGHGQPNTDYQTTIRECNELIRYLKKIVLMYEAADETVEFYSDNKATLNKTYEKEAKRIVKEFKPIWNMNYYDEQNEVKHRADNFNTDDPNKVKLCLAARIPDDTCTKAVATMVFGSPDKFGSLHSFHKNYVEIKEFKHDPIELLPEENEKYLKKPESKSEPEKTAMDAIFS